MPSVPGTGLKPGASSDPIQTRLTSPFVDLKRHAATVSREDWERSPDDIGSRRTRKVDERCALCFNGRGGEMGLGHRAHNGCGSKACCSEQPRMAGPRSRIRCTRVESTRRCAARRLERKSEVAGGLEPGLRPFVETPHHDTLERGRHGVRVGTDLGWLLREDRRHRVGGASRP